MNTLKVTSKDQLKAGDKVHCILHDYGKETEEIGTIVMGRRYLVLTLPSQGSYHSGKLKTMSKGGYVSAPWGMCSKGRIGARIISKIV